MSHRLIGSLSRGLVTACLVLSAPVAFATSEPSDTTLSGPLSIEEAINQAIRYNPDLAHARARVEARAGESRHASRFLPSNPEIEFEMGEQEATAGQDARSSRSIRIGQSLWLANQGGLAQDAAEARESAANRQVTYLRTRIAAQTRAAYLGVLVADRAVETAERVAALAEDNLRYATRKFEAGETGRVALNNARMGAGRARSILAEARHRQYRARLALAELMAVDPSRSLSLSGELRVPEIELPPENELLNAAVQRRADLAAVADEIEAADAELRRSNRQIVPNVELFGFAKRRDGAPDEQGLGFEMALPLAHQYQGENQTARARVRQAEIAQSRMRRRVRREVLQAMSAYRAAREQLTTTSQTVLDAAAENVRLTHQAYRAGEVGVSAVTTARQALMDTRETYLRGLRSLIQAAADLETATGGLLAATQRETSDPSQETSE